MVSIIIPTFNAEIYLEKLLDKLRIQSLKEYELIVIDSSSDDETVGIASKYTENVIVIPQKEFDHGGTRTKAAQMAKGEVIVFLTQDALPCNQHTIKNIVKIFNGSKIGAAYGKQVSYEETNLFGKHLREFNYTDEAYVRDASDVKRFGLKTAFLSDSFAAYRKSSLKAIGWFKDGLILGEDTYAGAKMILDGYSLAYVPDAKVYHSHSYTVLQEFKRYFDIGVFHQTEAWILRSFGKVEGEGMRYVKSEFNYLLAHNAWGEIPEFFVRNAMKYLGYKLGKNYKRCPRWLLVKLSMHYRWWSK